MNNLQRVNPSKGLMNINHAMSPLSMCRQCLRNTLRNQFHRPRLQPPLVARRTASTDGSKPIVLEQPDKFRPPSHPARLGRPRRPPAAYNQGTTTEEKERQKSKSYPHMFPNKGTFMHWFLTDRWIHLWITMGTLTILACITFTQSFMRTSPYAHLIPPISSLPLHPINYIRETLSVLRLHVDYETAKTNESRQQKILDAQKRRLYRRAHGLEDLNADEDQGIDVRGLVPWDDGLTAKEREKGGRDMVLTGRDMIALGGVPGKAGAQEDVDEFARRLETEQGERVKLLKEKGVDAVVKAEAEAKARGISVQDALQQQELRVQEMQDPDQGQDLQQLQQQQQKRKRKLWLGIW
ncbi:uncharacterized protein PV07_09154 [Cladophialophora immunda]|uniref:Uncharacterized protein n=1 Tax=Cladophialophora immunda TaxID=569365 RepID=A0A0D2C6E1_9EURO|nr:uncharacterized protein PV07_09154 [Cladophialophora immunda]KIW26025.1 hypothetical protein PV07_09154 [Cladophialophora immunda]OQU98014.1 hypothetical protein CLAIMM_03854 [Cladophialophora immunda]